MRWGRLISGRSALPSSTPKREPLTLTNVSTSPTLQSYKLMEDQNGILTAQEVLFRSDIVLSPPREISQSDGSENFVATPEVVTGPRIYECPTSFAFSHNSADSEQATNQLGYAQVDHDISGLAEFFNFEHERLAGQRVDLSLSRYLWFFSTSLFGGITFFVFYRTGQKTQRASK